MDDFYIFPRAGQDPYGIVALLAEFLATNEGLSLATHKTKLVEGFSEYMDILEFSAQERELAASDGALGKEERPQTPETVFFRVYADEVPDDEAIQMLRSFGIVDLLREEIEKEHWDGGKIRIFLRAMRVLNDEETLLFVLEKFNDLMPFAKDVVLLMEELSKTHGFMFGDLGEKVVDAILSERLQNLPLIRAWLLELFLRDVVPFKRSYFGRLKV